MMKSLLSDPSHAHWERRPFDGGAIVNGLSERWVPYEKIRDPKRAFGWSTWLDDIATNADGTRVIKEIFGAKLFDTPKPLALLEWVIGLCSNPDSVILDSFAGSGTTAHAVIAANNKDGGERRFILIECENYADSVTAERIRRVMGGYNFQGTQREELLKKSLTFSDLRRADKLLDQIASIENLDGHRFDRIEKKVRDGELLVEGVTTIEVARFV